MSTKKTRLFPLLMVSLWFMTVTTQAHESPDIFHALRLELDAGENRSNESVNHWDLDGWIGGDTNKLWLKSEGEMVDHNIDSSESWALYSRNVATFWDVQAGLRHDDLPDSMTYAVFGATGLAPYYFETEAHLFVSEEGDVSVRLREENDFLFTQKLILQPYLELNVFAQDVHERNVGAGVSDASVGLQLRYEVTRQFAPYIQFEYSRLFGDTADIAETNGDSRNDSALTAGVRFLF